MSTVLISHASLQAPKDRSPCAYMDSPILPTVGGTYYLRSPTPVTKR